MYTYVAPGQSKCFLQCTQRYKGIGYNSVKHQSGLDTARMNNQQPKWTMCCHKLQILGRAGFCKPGSDEPKIYLSYKVVDFVCCFIHSRNF